MSEEPYIVSKISDQNLPSLQNVRDYRRLARIKLEGEIIEVLFNGLEDLRKYFEDSPSDKPRQYDTLTIYRTDEEWPSVRCYVEHNKVANKIFSKYRRRRKL